LLDGAWAAHRGPWPRPEIRRNFPLRGGQVPSVSICVSSAARPSARIGVHLRQDPSAWIWRAHLRQPYDAHLRPPW